jgi:hypothetical protein
MDCFSGNKNLKTAVVLGGLRVAAYAAGSIANAKWRAGANENLNAIKCGGKLRHRSKQQVVAKRGAD